MLANLLIGVAVILGLLIGARRLLRGQGRILSMGSPRGVYGLLPDEILSDRVREHLSDFGLWGGHVDVTTVDGIVYLRGREESQARVDAIERTVRQLGGVVDVVAEMKVADLTRDRH